MKLINQKVSLLILFSMIFNALIVPTANSQVLKLEEETVAVETGQSLEDFARTQGAGNGQSNPRSTTGAGAPSQYSPSNWEDTNLLGNNGTSCPLIKEEDSHEAEVESILDEIEIYNNSTQDQECRIQYVDGEQSQLDIIRRRLLRQPGQQSLRAQVSSDSCDSTIYTRSIDLQLNFAIRRAQAYADGNIRNPNVPRDYSSCLPQLNLDLASFESCANSLRDQLIYEREIECEEILAQGELDSERAARRASQQRALERDQLRQEIEQAALIETFGAFNSVLNNDNCNANDLIPHFLGAAQMTLPSLLIGGGGPAFNVAAGAFETLFSAVRGILSSDEPTAEELIQSMRDEKTMNDQLCLNYELQQSALQCQERRRFYSNLLSSAESEREAIRSCRATLIDTLPESAIENSFVNLSSYVASSTASPQESIEARRNQVIALSNILNDNPVPTSSEGETEFYPDFLENTFSDFRDYLIRERPRSERRDFRRQRSELTRRIGQAINQNNNLTNGEEIAEEILLSIGRLGTDNSQASSLIASYNEISEYDEFDSTDEQASQMHSELTSNEEKMRIHKYLPDVMPFLLTTLSRDESLRNRVRENYEEIEARETLALRVRTLSNYENNVTQELSNMQARLSVSEDGSELESINSRSGDLARLLTIQGMYAEGDNLSNHVQVMIDDVNATESATVGNISTATPEVKEGLINILRSENINAEQMIDQIESFEGSPDINIRGAATSNKLKRLHTLISNCVIAQNNLSIQNDEGDRIVFADNRNNHVQECEQFLSCAEGYHSPAINLGNRTLDGGDSWNQIRDIMCSNMAKVDEFFADIAERYVNEGQLPNCSRGR